MLYYIILLSIILVHISALEKKAEIKFFEIKKKEGIRLPQPNNSNDCTIFHNDTLVQNTKDCSVSFNPVTYDQAGKWEIKSGKMTRLYRIFILNKKNTKKMGVGSRVMPTNSSSIFRMPKTNEKTLACYLIHMGEEQNDEEIFYNISAIDTKFIEPRDVCGVKITMLPDFEGPWRLYQIFERGIANCMHFNIRLTKETPVINQNIIETTLVVGDEFEIKLANAQNCKLSCQRLGQRYALQFCKYQFSSVKLEDTCQWHLYYEKQNPTYSRITQIYSLTVIEPKVETMVTYDNNSDIHLLCYIKFKTGKSDCRFEHPNGTMYIITDIIGTEKYEYYTNFSAPTENDKYCGLTIKNADESDYGTWRCFMSFGKPLRSTFGSILQVKTPKQNRNKFFNKDVYVKSGSSFKLSCMTNEIIHRCWMISPNGSIFVINEKNENSDFNYTGRGFSVGDCEAVIENATFDYHGDWKCQLKVESGSRIESRISVTVSKSVVRPKQEAIIYTGSPITMSCFVIPSETFDFDICRWITPDGNGIHYESDFRYQMEHTHRECNLVVSDSQIQKGQYTCVLQSTLNNQLIKTATIRVYSESSYNAITAIGIPVICICLISGVSSFLCVKKVPKVRSFLNFELK